MSDIVKKNEHHPLASWDPFRMMRDMLRWDPLFRDPMAYRDVWMPSFEVRENGSAIKLIADLPGVDKDDLEINVTGNQLVISGRREAEERSKDEHFHTYERTFGQFTRSFTLPDYADLDHITSDLRDGVLTIAVPKTSAAKSRKVPISSAATKS